MRRNTSVFESMLAVGIAWIAASCGGSQVHTPIPTAPASGVAVQILGFVLDATLRPLPDVSVEIQNQTRTVATVVTDAAGEYRFSGTFVGAITFRAVKDGFLAATQSVTPSPRDTNTGPTFILDTVAGSLTIDEGEYTAIFRADSACSMDLPEDVRTRTYAATITHSPRTSSVNQYIAEVAGT